MRESTCVCFLQLFSEKISGAEGTKLDEEFLDMEKVRLFEPVTGAK